MLSKELTQTSFESVNIDDLISQLEYNVYEYISTLYYLSNDKFDISLFINFDKLPYLSLFEKDYDYVLKLEEISNYLMLDKKIHTKLEICLILMRNYEHFKTSKKILDNIYLPKEIIVKHDLLLLDWCLKANYHTYSDNYLYLVAIEKNDVESLKILYESKKLIEFCKNDLYYARMYKCRDCIDYLIKHNCPSYTFSGSYFR